MNNFLFIHGGHNGGKWFDKKLTWRKILFNEYQYYPQSRACHTLSKINKKIYMYVTMVQKVLGISTFSTLKPKSGSELPWNFLRWCLLPEKPIRPPWLIKISTFLEGSQNVHLNDLLIFDPSKNLWDSQNLYGSIPTGLRGH